LWLVVQLLKFLGVSMMLAVFGRLKVAPPVGTIGLVKTRADDFQLGHVRVRRLAAALPGLFNAIHPA
jgi:hypothetical protein